MRTKSCVLALMATAAVGWLTARPASSADEKAEEEIRARFEAFNRAWEQRDIAFVRDYYAHDADMLLFFERRQLLGWPRVETLYENMFDHAARGRVESSTSNLQVKAVGNLGYVAANFHLQITEPSGEVSADVGRQSVVFERREGRWVVVHRHTSFQAPPGPQRKVPLHTEPGPLWSPNLEGAWQLEDGGVLVASASHLAFTGVDGLPSSARYRREDDGIFLESLSATPLAIARLELVELSAIQLVFRLPGQATNWVWERLE
jgi:uncharacterized protein (TIGR02246 family)